MVFQKKIVNITWKKIEEKMNWITGTFYRKIINKKHKSFDCATCLF